jgi:oligopeptide/dipeptide ABC transporter ATP-binding protein
MGDVLLDIRKLTVKFESRFGTVNAVNGINLTLNKGESLGIVGESGSGKSVTGLSIMRLLDRNASLSADRISFDGENLLQKTESEMRRIRGSKISMIFQDPLASLNPVLSLGNQIEEAIHIHSGQGRKKRYQKVLDMLNSVGIPDPELNCKAYPHQFSGGMNQRVMIAIALSCKPSLLIADEPTTALDVTTQAQILDLLKKLIREEQATLLMISHDFGVIREACERVCVMYCGDLLEEGPVQDLLSSPLHPYTEGLIKSIPKLKGSERLEVIPGNIPKGTNLPSGCVFHPRCHKVKEICVHERPAAHSIKDDHRVKCFALDPDRKKLWR